MLSLVHSSYPNMCVFDLWIFWHFLIPRSLWCKVISTWEPLEHPDMCSVSEVLRQIKEMPSKVWSGVLPSAKAVSKGYTYRNEIVNFFSQVYNLKLRQLDLVVSESELTAKGISKEHCCAGFIVGGNPWKPSSYCWESRMICGQIWRETRSSRNTEDEECGGALCDGGIW